LRPAEAGAAASTAAAILCPATRHGATVTGALLAHGQLGPRLRPQSGPTGPRFIFFVYKRWGDDVKLSIFGLVALAILVLGSAQTLAQNAYITNAASMPGEAPGTVSVLDTSTNAITATIPVGITPWGVAVSHDGARVYITNRDSNDVSVINTATNTVVATIPLDAGGIANGIAVSPDDTRVYAADFATSDVTVINAKTDAAIATIPVGGRPFGVAISPDGSKVWVANGGLSLIDTTSYAVTTVAIPGRTQTTGVAVTPDGKKVFVLDIDTGTVCVLDVANNSVTNIPIGASAVPLAIAVSPDGTRVYVTGFFQTLRQSLIRRRIPSAQRSPSAIIRLVYR